MARTTAWLTEDTWDWYASEYGLVVRTEALEELLHWMSQGAFPERDAWGTFKTESPAVAVALADLYDNKITRGEAMDVVLEW